LIIYLSCKKLKKYILTRNCFLIIGVDDSGALCQLSSKFGANISICPSLLIEAQAMGLNVVGISFHVGSGQQTVEAYIDAIDRSNTIFDFAKSIGLNLSVLDIGGGFPGDDDDNVFLGFEQVALGISQKIDETFPNFRVIAEPGRYFAAACCTLVTKVCSIKEQTEDEGSKFSYYLNDGVYGTFNNILLDHASTVIPSFLRDTKNDVLYKSTVFGPTCDSLDTIKKKLSFAKT